MEWLWEQWHQVFTGYWEEAGDRTLEYVVNHMVEPGPLEYPQGQTRGQPGQGKGTPRQEAGGKDAVAGPAKGTPAEAPHGAPVRVAAKIRKAH